VVAGADHWFCSRRPRLCLVGGHALWWRVQADDAAAALALLPKFVARRTVPIEIRDVEIP
jgi:hypothetical protein